MDGLLGLSGRPVTARSSFYYILSYGIGSYSVSVQKSERIENYAIRLKEMIELLKSKSGADKVDVVALSMGGLVAREYVSLFGSGSIHKIVTINTPHHGISGNVKTLCSVLGSSKECDDMSEGSVFLNRLNSESVPENIYVIRSVGCKMGDTTGDGIVTNESGYLAGAENYVIHGNCTDSLGVSLHGSAIEPDTHPETFELLIDILKG
jgi:pimeloyl-ACP methyl ester carboxylesterase